MTGRLPRSFEPLDVLVDKRYPCASQQHEFACRQTGIWCL